MGRIVTDMRHSLKPERVAELVKISFETRRDFGTELHRIVELEPIARKFVKKRQSDRLSAKALNERRNAKQKNVQSAASPSQG